MILAGLIGAITWDLITWYWGLPTSSSHALIGGFAGAALVKAGFGSLVASGLIKIGVFMVLAPLIGARGGLRDDAADHVGVPERRRPGASTGSSGAASSSRPPPTASGHGTNDAQKTMGIIAVLLFTTGHLGPTSTCRCGSSCPPTPRWRSARMAGGWRIVKTMGMRITKLRPVGGFCAETAGAITLIGTALGGIPVSTTQTISGSIMGVGAIQRFSAVRWGVAGRILWAWVLTIPASALVAAATWMLLRLLGA